MQITLIHLLQGAISLTDVLASLPAPFGQSVILENGAGA